MLKQEIDELSNKVTTLDVTNNRNQEKEEETKIENKVEEKVELLTDANKVSYNEKLKGTLVRLMIDSKKTENGYNSGKFNDYEKYFLSSMAANSDESKYSNEFSANATQIDGPMYYVNMQFLNKISKEIFEEEINFKNTGAEINSDKIKVSFLTGLGLVGVYKAKSLILDKTINEYELEIDLISVIDYNEKKLKEVLSSSYIDYEESEIT